MAQRKIRVVARTWADVEALCDAQSEGRSFLTVRGDAVFEPGELLLLSLSLPGELVLGIDVQVVAAARDDGGDCVARLELAGFSPEMASRLRGMAVREGSPARREGAYLRVPTREHAPVVDDVKPDDGAVLATIRPRRTPSEPVPAGNSRPAADSDD